MPGPYPFSQIFAADPFNTANVATGASVLLFAPGDASMTPLVITDASTGRILANPVQTNANGWGPAFAHETLDQVAWEGGGFNGTFESYRGMKDAADESAGAAKAAADSAQEAAANAAETVQEALAGTVAVVEAAKLAAQAAAGLVGAPAGAAVLAAISPGGAAEAALNAAYAPAQGSLSYMSTSVPPYAGLRSKTWDSASHIYNGESPTLRKIRSIIARSRTGAAGAYVAAIGDSKTAGTGTTAGAAGKDSYPAQLIDLLGASEGISYAERGSASDSRWTGVTGFAPIDSAVRLALTAPAGTASSATFTTTAACTGFDVWLYQAGSTVTNVTVTIDGGAGTAYPAPRFSGYKKVSITGLANATHTITVTYPGTLSLSILGIQPTYNSPRLVISNVSRTGSQASHWTDTGWTENGAVALGLLGNETPKPDAALLNIGTNDAGSNTSANIEAVVSMLTTKSVPTMLIVPGGLLNNSFANRVRLETYRLADVYDLPLLDFTNLIGTYEPANAAGLMTDSSHENARGYALEADAVARAVASY